MIVFIYKQYLNTIQYLNTNKNVSTSGIQNQCSTSVIGPPVNPSITERFLTEFAD